MLLAADAFGAGVRVGAIHSHPFLSGQVAFSGTDHASFRADRGVFEHEFGGVEFVALVTDRDATAFEGLVIDRDQWAPVDEVQVVGATLQRIRCARAPARTDGHGGEIPELYRRMGLIPSWEYPRVADLNVTVVGASGLGAPIVQLLALLGVGERGVTTLIDDDLIEPTNRSRIPYATPDDDGRAKVEVGARYLRTVRPDREVRTLAVPLFAAEAQRAIAASDVLIGAVDSELARLAMNELAHALCLPYLDAGSGVLVSRVDGAPMVHSGGQVRLVVPGVTPCLLCNLGIDREAADRELARRLIDRDAAERTLLERSGYIRGLDGAVEQPSVAHLNFLVAAALVNVLVEYLLRGRPAHHALHLDLAEMQWMASLAEPRPGCTVCQGQAIGHGRPFRLEDLVVPVTLPPEPIDV
jgi:molybdopterin/thiamine biosynthesis adenylyltransferase